MAKAFNTVLLFSYIEKLIIISYQTKCILSSRPTKEKKLKNI